jgi:hypothetical protein
MINNRPMVVYVAYSTDWDVVWRLIELGARLDMPEVKTALTEAFKFRVRRCPTARSIHTK